jgi:hypothetical protein
MKNFPRARQVVKTELRKKEERRFRLTFDRASIPFVLRAFKKKLDADGFIVTENGCRVLDASGATIHESEFAGIGPGEVFLKNDLASRYARCSGWVVPTRTERKRWKEKNDTLC